MFTAVLLLLAVGEDQQILTRDNLAEWVRKDGRILGMLQAQERVRQAGAILANAKYQGADKAAIKRWQKELGEAKAALKKPGIGWPEMFADHLQVNQIGVLRRRFVRPGDDQAQRYEVLQIIDANNMIVQMEMMSRGIFDSLWLEIPTSGKADERNYLTGDQVFEVVGTKRYETAIGGTKTIFHLRRFDWKDQPEK